MAADWNHNLPPEAYALALRAELQQASLPRERKAAIVDELERLGGRTGVENRDDVETAAAPSGRAETATTAGAETRGGRHACDGFDGR